MKRISAFSPAAVLLLVAMSIPVGAGKVELPPYKERTLSNGLRVFLMETREVPLVDMRLLIPAGSARDTEGLEGVANLTANLLMKGAAGMGAEEISEAVEGAGGRLVADASRDFTLLTGSFMSRDLATALDILSKVIIEPDFPEEELERERGMIEAGIQSVKENPSWLANREFVRTVVGGHPYAHPVEGSMESVSKITRDDVLNFHRDHYVPTGSILAVVGDVNWKAALEEVKRRFGGWRGRPQKEHPIGPLDMKRQPRRRVIVIDKPDATQSQIRIGNIAVRRNTPDNFPLLVANNILGGGFTSRLVDEIRVNRGLSYGVSSELSQLLDGGIFGIYTFTKNETLRKTVDVALDELERIRTERVGEQELLNSKRYLSGLFPFELETNRDLARWLTEVSFYGLDENLAEGYRDRVDRVSPEDIQRVAQKYFHVEDCLILLLTNLEEVRDQLEGLGDIQFMGIDEID